MFNVQPFQSLMQFPMQARQQQFSAIRPVQAMPTATTTTTQPNGNPLAGGTQMATNALGMYNQGRGAAQGASALANNIGNLYGHYFDATGVMPGSVMANSANLAPGAAAANNAAFMSGGQLASLPEGGFGMANGGAQAANNALFMGGDASAANPLAAGAAGATDAAAAGTGAATDAVAAGTAAGADTAALTGASVLGPVALGGAGIYGLGKMFNWW